MDWDEIIERSVERLVAVLTELFVMAGAARLSCRAACQWGRSHLSRRDPPPPHRAAPRAGQSAAPSSAPARARSTSSSPAAITLRGRSGTDRTRHEGSAPLEISARGHAGRALARLWFGARRRQREAPLSVLPDISPARGEILSLLPYPTACIAAIKSIRAERMISPLAGEMSGRTERGASR
jgi:hypothetical protein